MFDCSQERSIAMNAFQISVLTVSLAVIRTQSSFTVIDGRDVTNGSLKSFSYSKLTDTDWNCTGTVSRHLEALVNCNPYVASHYLIRLRPAMAKWGLAKTPCRRKFWQTPVGRAWTSLSEAANFQGLLEGYFVEICEIFQNFRRFFGFNHWFNLIQLI